MKTHKKINIKNFLIDKKKILRIISDKKTSITRREKDFCEEYYEKN